MSSDTVVSCDGCGRAANSQHIAARLRRLEWSTRSRPLHVQTLFLGFAMPDVEEEFLYSPASQTRGEAAAILAAGLMCSERGKEEVLAELQKKGVFLAHVIECPLEAGEGELHLASLAEKRLPQVILRIARSIKPQRIVVLPGVTNAVIEGLRKAGLGELQLHRG